MQPSAAPFAAVELRWEKWRRAYPLLVAGSGQLSLRFQPRGPRPHLPFPFSLLIASTSPRRNAPVRSLSPVHNRAGLQLLHRRTANTSESSIANRPPPSRDTSFPRRGTEAPHTHSPPGQAPFAGGSPNARQFLPTTRPAPRFLRCWNRSRSLANRP
jgi:hypothetical protein